MSPTHLFVMLAFAAAPLAWADGLCSRDEAIEVEESASTLKSWPEVVASFQRFRHCDDGSIAEEYSESITKTLDTHWSTVGSLHELSHHEQLMKSLGGIPLVIQSSSDGRRRTGLTSSYWFS